MRIKYTTWRTKKKIFNELVEKTSSEFRSLEKRINPDNLIYEYKIERRSPKDFRNYQNPIELFKELRDGNINPEEVLKDQVNFKSDLDEIKKGNRKSKPEDQSVIQDVEIFFNLREKNGDFFKDYSFLLSEAKYKAKYGEGFKILTGKQMLQKLPIALAQVKAGNTSENSLNEIRQIIYFLYWAKEITNNVYNNIMNSINL